MPSERRDREGLVQEPLNKGLKPVAHGGLNATGKIDLAVERGQELNGLQPSRVFNDRASVVHKFVSQVLKRVTKLLETVSGLGGDPASNHGAPLNRRSFRQEREMTVLHRRPSIFQDGKILTVYAVYVFDITQLLGSGWLSVRRFAFEVRGTAFGFNCLCDAAH
jgi:hypothetical protein